MRHLLFSLSLLFSFYSFSQTKKQDHILLTNPRVQFECMEAIDSMYNFNFTVSEKQYNWLKQQHPEHPLPYFLLGLNEWWKILPNEYVKDYDKTFVSYMNLTIKKAKKLYKKDKKNPEATFFLSAAYGFKARLNAERGNYTASTLNARKSLSYLEENKEANPELVPEFMFGVALYNYFREWVPENQHYLRPVLMFFSKGDKKLGIEQLQKVASQSFYTRIEAMRFLVKIYSGYEKQHLKAWDHIKYLHQLYPKNPYFTRTYVKIAYKLNKKEEAMTACLQALDHVENQSTGFENETGRICSYILGHFYDRENNREKTKFYFDECIRYTEMPNAYSTGYTVIGAKKLAQYAIDNKDNKEAFQYYLKIKELSNDKRSETYKKAKKYVRKNKKEYK